MSLTVNNSRNETFIPPAEGAIEQQDVLEWRLFPEKGNVLSLEGFICGAEQECQWELDLSKLDTEFPNGNYRLLMDSTEVMFTVE